MIHHPPLQYHETNIEEENYLNNKENKENFSFIFLKFLKIFLLSILTISSIIIFSMIFYFLSISNKNKETFHLKGNWTDDYNNTIEITETKWIEYYNNYPNTISIKNIYSYTIPKLLKNKKECQDIQLQQFTPCTTEGVIISQNSINNTWFPSRWNRIHYFHNKKYIYHFCTVYFNKNLLEEVKIPPSHPELFNIDNLTNGCGGFPMSILKRK